MIHTRIINDSFKVCQVLWGVFTMSTASNSKLDDIISNLEQDDSQLEKLITKFYIYHRRKKERVHELRSY